MMPAITKIIKLFGRSGQSILVACTVFAVFAPTTSAQMGLDCGSLKNGYGPYDYSNAKHRSDLLPVVEIAHFDSGVESLRGHTRKPNGLVGLGADLDYTLRAFPNHHKALYAMIQYSLSEDPNHRRPMRYSAECYLKRAMTFQPKDGKVHLLYGIYLSKVDRLEDAKKEFLEAENLMPNSAEVHYNIGLVLAKNGDYQDARTHAYKAYNLGYPLPGLRNILKRAGQWIESTP